MSITIRNLWSKNNSSGENAVLVILGQLGMTSTWVDKNTFMTHRLLRQSNCKMIFVKKERSKHMIYCDLFSSFLICYTIKLFNNI